MIGGGDGDDETKSALRSADDARQSSNLIDAYAWALHPIHEAKRTIALSLWPL